MDTVFQISGLAVIASIACCLLKPHIEGFSTVLSIAAGTLILMISFGFLKPVLNVLLRLSQIAHMDSTAVAPLMKVTGIGLLVKIAESVCEDAGDKTLCNAVQIGGTLLALYVSLPLISAVLDLLEEMLTG